MLKIGDKVKVRNNLEVGKFYGSILFTRYMERFKGEEVVILRITPKETNSFNITFYKIEGSVACWTEEMFEPIKEDVESKKKKYIVLPCEIGDTIYYIDDFHKKIVPVTVEGIYFYECGFKLHVSSEWSYFDLKENEWYPTQKAAEKALKSMK